MLSDVECPFSTRDPVSTVHWPVHLLDVVVARVVVVVVRVVVVEVVAVVVVVVVVMIGPVTPIMNILLKKYDRYCLDGL